MNKKLVISILFVSSLFLATAFAENCWDYSDTDEATCESSGSCTWHEDPWGSWCEETGCWNLWTQESCMQANNETDTTNFINKSCSWSDSSSGSCMNLDCWTFDGNETGCLAANTEYGIECSWRSECVGPPEKGCWGYIDNETCSDVAGCEWGMCYKKSCWDYTTQESCEDSGSVGFNGKQCQWKTYSSGYH